MMTFRSGSHLGLKARKLCKDVYFGIHLARPCTQEGKTELKQGDRVVVNRKGSLETRERQAAKQS